MGQPLLDTSVFSTYIKQINANVDSYYFSSVVFYELIASLIDESTMQKYASWESTSFKTKRLITPTRTDWIISAKAIRQLRHLRLIDKNLSATSLQNDALIARCASMHNCFIVTDNIRDFTLLQKVMPKLDVIPANEFFG